MVMLSSENLEWYEQQYAGATLSWALDMLFTNFRLAHVSTPGDYAKIAAENGIKSIEDLF